MYTLSSRNSKENHQTNNTKHSPTSFYETNAKTCHTS
ncbi:unnamed protein product [Schistosoma margrebowiei]|uniref:Uncharacterized protein n=1 Tax=Schistosoma margrebowiei TaxID=48269 RepID=A0A183M3R7_9TREM|nr:unnamed protein product [Schistosoma margrebowiei]